MYGIIIYYIPAHLSAKIHAGCQADKRINLFILVNFICCISHQKSTFSTNWQHFYANDSIKNIVAKGIAHNYAFIYRDISISCLYVFKVNCWRFYVCGKGLKYKNLKQHSHNNPFPHIDAFWCLILWLNGEIAHDEQFLCLPEHFQLH